MVTLEAVTYCWAWEWSLSELWSSSPTVFTYVDHFKMFSLCMNKCSIIEGLRHRHMVNVTHFDAANCYVCYETPFSIFSVYIVCVYLNIAWCPTDRATPSVRLRWPTWQILEYQPDSKWFIFQFWSGATRGSFIPTFRINPACLLMFLHSSGPQYMGPCVKFFLRYCFQTLFLDTSRVLSTLVRLCVLSVCVWQEETDEVSD